MFTLERFKIRYLSFSDMNLVYMQRKIFSEKNNLSVTVKIKYKNIVNSVINYISDMFTK